MDKLIDLLNQIGDVEVEIEELKECGDLEGILEASLLLEDLWAQHLQAKMQETGSR